MKNLALGASLLLALHTATGCIITEDAEAGGVTVEVTWECPEDASDLEIVAFPVDADGFITGEGIGDSVACDQAQPYRVRYDAGDWYVEATPLGSRAYYTDFLEFTGEDLEVVALDFAFSPALGAFQYTWEIGGGNPLTRCDSSDVDTVTIVATLASGGESYTTEFPCKLGSGQSQPIPLDDYMISGDAGGESTTLEVPWVLIDPSGLIEVDVIDLLPPA